MSYYYTDANNQPVGPLSSKELHEARRVGQLGDDTFVIEEGTAEWRAYRNFVPPDAPAWSPPRPPSTPPIPVPNTTGRPKRSRLSLVALALCLWSFMMLFATSLLGGAGAIGAIVCGHVSWSRRKSSGGGRRAMIALVMGYLLLLAAFVGLIAPPSSSTINANSTIPIQNASTVTTWKYVTYQGKHDPYMLVLPSYWREISQVSDANADRMFAGPNGIILTLYPFDETQASKFWDVLQKRSSVTTSTGNNIDDEGSRDYEVEADQINGMRLTYVLIGALRNTKIAFSLRIPTGFSATINQSIKAAILEILSTMQRIDKGEKLDSAALNKQHSASEDKLLAALSANEDAADGPWVPRVRALTESNSRNAGFSDGFQAATQFVIRFSYSASGTADMQDQLSDAKSVTLGAYDQLARKHDLDRRVYNTYRRAWAEGFDACARTASVNPGR